LIYGSPLAWVIMFAPLIFVFGFSAMINRMSAAAAQLVFYTFAAVMGLSLSSIFLVFTAEFDRAGVPDHGDRLRRPVAVGLHHQEGHLRLGHRS
jgi:FtsH-binding integral membrane protein